MTSYAKYLHKHSPEVEQSILLCEATRFRITSEVLGEIARGDKTVRALKPKE